VVGDAAHLWNTKAQLQYLQHLAANLPGPDVPPAERDSRLTPKVARRLKDHEIKELVAAYEAGSTLRQLAERFKIERRTVSKILKRQGVATRWRRLSEADIDKAEHLYAQGWSSARIADLLKVDPETVRLRLRKRGVQMRDPHQRG
jgi:DNA-directed RNA polymerase specialized sigma24 family protein